MSSQIELITNAIDMSEALLTLAEQQNWPQFVELSQQRQHLITQLDLQSAQVDANQYDALHEKMADLITLNNQIETICRQQRDEIADNLKQLHKGKNAKNAYSE